MLLSETELRAALEPLLDRLLSERLRLFQLQFEARVQALIAAALQPQQALELQDGLRKIASGRTAPQTFAALFEAGAGLAGRECALLVIRGGEAAVWKAEGITLPRRFPARQCAQHLSNGMAVKVRGTTVGYFGWRGAELPAPVAARLKLMLQFAGLVLLETSLPAAKASTVAAAVAGATPATERPRAASEAGRFAELLIEDLQLFLSRERAQDLAQGVHAGDWRERFAPEIERCRQAFAARYSGAGDGETFEEVVPRLGEALRS